MFSLGAQEVMTSSLNGETLKHRMLFSACLKIQADMGICGLATEPQLKMYQILPVLSVHRSANRHLTGWEQPVRSLLLRDAALASCACPQCPPQGESSALV